MNYCYIDSPIGALMLVGAQGVLHQIVFSEDGHAASPAADDWLETRVPFRSAMDQLAQYFAGQRQTFDLALEAHGTAFQKRVWQGLRDIPYGTTETYSGLAAQIGKPKAVRAVGAANGANPLPIVVPCHRVIGADGTLTGYAGGLSIKQRLLEIEGALAWQPRLPATHS